MMREGSTVVEADDSAPRLSRAFCAEWLGSWLPRSAQAAEVIEDVELIASELVTNAVLAGSTHVGVRLCLDGGVLVLTVDDDAPGVPVVQPGDPTAGHGRGLAIVDQIAARWGVSPTPMGKGVWAELTGVGS
jgi:anti-sigma regulatory factor (Ser/Thr protein kinase)